VKIEGCGIEKSYCRGICAGLKKRRNEANFVNDSKGGAAAKANVKANSAAEMPICAPGKPICAGGGRPWLVRVPHPG
jgi:hypothetical protein